MKYVLMVERKDQMNINLLVMVPCVTCLYNFFSTQQLKTRSTLTLRIPRPYGCILGLFTVDYSIILLIYHFRDASSHFWTPPNNI